MNKRTPRIISLIFQGAFSLVCILNIILCTIHRQNFDTDFGRRCADIALDLTFILFLFLLIALPTSLLLNIIARFPNDEPQKKRRLWKLWTVLSPAFYVILWFVSLGVFISSTGGVWYTASFLSKPQAWYIITRQRVFSCGLMIYNTTCWWYAIPSELMIYTPYGVILWRVALMPLIFKDFFGF